MWNSLTIPWWFAALPTALHMLSVTHIMPVLVLNTCMDANTPFTINSFRKLFPDISLIFSKIPDISLTAVKFPDISRFSRQVVTLNVYMVGINNSLGWQKYVYDIRMSHLPEESATSFSAISMLSPSTNAKDRLTHPAHHDTYDLLQTTTGKTRAGKQQVKLRHGHCCVALWAYTCKQHGYCHSPACRYVYKSYK